jgi:hypothetical protein
MLPFDFQPMLDGDKIEDGTKEGETDKENDDDGGQGDAAVETASDGMQATPSNNGDGGLGILAPLFGPAGGEEEGTDGAAVANLGLFAAFAIACTCWLLRKCRSRGKSGGERKRGEYALPTAAEADVPKDYRDDEDSYDGGDGHTCGIALSDISANAHDRYSPSGAASDTGGFATAATTRFTDNFTEGFTDNFTGKQGGKGSTVNNDDDEPWL